MWNSGFFTFIPWAVALFFIIAAAVLVILWIALPFSLFGVKGLLRELIDEQKKANALIGEVKRELVRRVEKEGPKE
ncbi:MAG: hypothetical protein ACE5GF_00495 [Thermodesulfobacteriota bacterium]